MTMDRTIFDMNLSVEATSLYILICSNSVGEHDPTLKMLTPVWNGSDEQLRSATVELIEHGILLNSLPPTDSEPLRVAGSHCWLQP
jgi:hypothetical protein